jgi:hypothetical protein
VVGTPALHSRRSGPNAVPETAQDLATVTMKLSAVWDITQ